MHVSHKFDLPTIDLLINPPSGPTVAVVASTSDWNAPPRRRSISTVCGPSHREINQFYANFFPEKEVPQQYGVYNPAYLNQPTHHNVYFGQRCPDNSAPVYDPGRFSPPQLDTPPPPVLNTQEQSDFNLGSSSGGMFSSFEKHNNNCWSSNAKINNPVASICREKVTVLMTTYISVMALIKGTRRSSRQPVTSWKVLEMEE
ncbi:hypothetical protein Y032_0106g3726 [Ancylostoma ceylanicum]|uniref:Uncharacterized protein n=1 Tax=Ancylostoma ceylanicum TaxID=53326 RepID=A0A016TFQ9_9BILA|nr:hypothetical protein Y032_0106g3726 [Ancylostoma ceylanicum]